TNRRQPDHLGGETGIGFEQLVLAGTCATSSAIMCTGVRVLRNTGSPPMISGLLSARERARRKPRSDVARLGEARVGGMFAGPLLIDIAKEVQQWGGPRCRGGDRRRCR